MRSYPGIPWSASDVTGGPVDELFAAPRQSFGRLKAERLTVSNPNDDDTVRVITRARDGAEIQIGTFPSGRLPFHVEADDEGPVDHQRVDEPAVARGRAGAEVRVLAREALPLLETGVPDAPT